MFLEKELVKKIGAVDEKLISQFANSIRNDFKKSWVQRTLKVMDSSLVIKALTPTQLDRSENSGKLFEIAFPIIEPFVNQSERLVYLDVSCFPPGSSSLVHFDYAWIHVLSRRIHVPIMTNEKAIYAALDEDNKVHSYHLGIGSVYETNNQTLHAVANYGTTDRWHIVADVIDETAYEFLRKTNNLDKPYINRWSVFHLNQKVKSRIETALKLPPSDQA